jgi:uncharacterized protein YndB with AHSA1/START domain
MSKQTQALVVRRLVPAPRARVFEAWTRPEIMAQWFAAAPDWRCEATADVTVGGSYRLRMVEPSGAIHEQFGEYREIVPVSRLVFTWSCPEVGVKGSVVTLELEDRGEKTELILTHELPDDAEIRRSHEQGWTGCLTNLDRFFEQDRRTT